MKGAIIASFLAISISIATLPAWAQGTYSCSEYFDIVQNNPQSCLLTWGWDSLPDPNAPANMVCCNPGGEPFGESCVAKKYSCRAPVDPDPVCTTCQQTRELPNSTPDVGAPINLSSGNTFITESDISVPGLGGGLSLSRTWNSKLPADQNSYPFMFGNKWRSNYEERLIFVAADGYVKYLRSDGSVYSFGVYQSGSPVVYKAAAPAIDTTTTITNGSPNWTVTFQSGEKKLFDATTGALVAIIDRNGNTTSLTYDAAQRLTTVTDPASRHLTFNYPDGSSTLVSSVTSDVGLSLSYTYDLQGRLTRLTRPDNTTISFAYDTQNMITTVTDSDGKVLESHTYDAMGRGLTSSRANGVDAVTVTYPQ